MEVMECEGVSKRNDMKETKDEKKQNYEGRRNIFVDVKVFSHTCENKIKGANKHILNNS
jgi:hypothetical protein